MLLARSVEAGNVARAAAAFALGELGAKEATLPLLTLTQGADALPRQAALLALARLQSDSAPSAIAAGILHGDPGLRESSVLAALVLETGEYRSPRDALPVPDGSVDVRTILQQLTPSGYSASERAKALISESASLREALRSTSLISERARAFADALLARDGKPAFSPFTDGIETIDPDLRKKAEDCRRVDRPSGRSGLHFAGQLQGFGCP